MTGKILGRIAGTIDRISDLVGFAAAYLLPVIALVLIYEVFMRYVLNQPTIWGHETSQHVFGIMFILAGAYALRLGAHVNVDIIVRRFPPRIQAVVHILTFFLFALFFVVLIKTSIPMAINSWEKLEVTMSPWGAPYYPLKTAVPVGAFLILLQGGAKLIRDVYFAATGRELA